MRHLRLVHSGEPTAPTPAPVTTLSRERREHMHMVVLKLPRDERIVVLDHFFENKSLQQIADEMGVTEVEVRDVRERAMQLLKRSQAFG